MNRTRISNNNFSAPTTRLATVVVIAAGFATALAAALVTGFSTSSRAAQTCTNRGDLDAIYCDQNKDLLADAPSDPAKRKNPSTILMSYTPQEFMRKWGMAGRC